MVDGAPNSFNYKKTVDEKDLGIYDLKYTVCYVGDSQGCPQSDPFQVEIVDPCADAELFGQLFDN